MKEKLQYVIKDFPSSRQSTFNVGYIGVRNHHMKALLELDITYARELIKDYRNKNRAEMAGTVVVTSVAMIGNVRGWVIPVTIHPICFALGSIMKKPGIFEGKITPREYHT